MRSWETEINEYKIYLALERSLSGNTLEAYMRDINKLYDFINIKKYDIPVYDVDPTVISEFIVWINEFGICQRTQARILSGIKSFFKFLLFTDKIDTNPAINIEGPKLGLYLPEVLAVDEIDKMIDTIDLSKAEGHRNRAIIETLFSCGLRVSELVNLRISNIFFDDEYIRVIGKGDKQRLVPISAKAIKEIKNYLITRNQLPNIDKDFTDILFLNRRGRALTRVMIFTIIKEAAKRADIDKNVSPHTLRHSFATELINRGADLRAIQDMLGHESINTTEIYTHLESGTLQDTILRYHPRS